MYIAHNINLECASYITPKGRP